MRNYYHLTETAAEIQTMALAWLDLDLPVTVQIAQQVAALPFIDAMGALQQIWNAVTRHYTPMLQKSEGVRAKATRAPP